MNELSITSALLIGLLGSTHCIGMCGGISAALGIDPRSGDGRGSRHFYLLSYNLGRISTYTALGALAGLFGQQVVGSLPGMGLILRTIAGLLLVAMGLYVSQLWMGLTRLEQLGAHLWRYLQPVGRRLLPVKNHRQATLLGGLWGLLPCGLVYSTLSWSLAAADWQRSALFMLAFGVGTLPAMLFAGMLSRQLLNKIRGKRFRVSAGLIIIVIGLITIVIPFTHQLGDHGHSGGGHNHSLQ